MITAENLRRAGKSSVLAALLLAGCSIYHAAPLPTAPDLAATLPNQALPAKRIDPTQPLDPTDLAILAVINDPDLKAARLTRNLGQAQIFDARLLPDPQFAYAVDYPLTAGAARAVSYGLSEDIGAILARGPKIAATTATARAADLNELWQEWQVAQQARQLGVTLAAQTAKFQLLQAGATLFQSRATASAEALRQGDLSAADAGADLAAAADAQTQADAMAQNIDQSRHDLAALLGITLAAPLAVTPLSDPSLAPTTPPDISAIATRRPDLLALQAGYNAQDATYRAAILGQFPDITLGGNRARDNSNINSAGFSLGLSLPLFNANRGQVAIAQATRAQLRQEYQARLDAAALDIALLLRQQSELKASLAAANAELPRQSALLAASTDAWQRHDLDTQSFVTAQNNLLQQQQARIDLQQNLSLNQIALETLLGQPPAELSGNQP